MKITCSGSQYLEPIETSTCLDCALAKENDCGYGYRLLKAIFETQTEDRSKEIHVTDITSCLKKAYLDKVTVTPPFVHDLLYLFIGIAVHTALDIDDDNVTSEVSFNEGGLMGRADAIFIDTLEDVKTTRWLTPYKLPYGEHEKQVNIYNYFMNKENIQIQYIDLSGPTKCKKCRPSVPMRMIDGLVQCPACGHSTKAAHLGAVMYDVDREDMGDFIDKRVSQLSLSMANGEVPEAEPSFLCGYCAHEDCEHNHKRDQYAGETK